MHSLHHLQTKTGAGDPLAAPVFLIDWFLHALPLRAAGHVGHFDALRLELIADTVSLGKVLRLFGLRALADQVLDALVRRAVLRDDREAAHHSSPRKKEYGFDVEHQKQNGNIDMNVYG